MTGSGRVPGSRFFRGRTGAATVGQSARQDTSATAQPRAPNQERPPMKKIPLLAALACCTTFPVLALVPGHARADEHAHLQVAGDSAAPDPFAPVYIVSSRESFQSGLSAIADAPRAVRDSTGAPLVISRVEAHELPLVSHHIHAGEHRCGGYFAFTSEEDARRFLQSEQSARALTATFADYSIDNQATVGPWLPQVQETGIRSTIEHLSTAWPNRYYASSSGQAAAEWIRDRWAGLAQGRDDVDVELFACASCSTQDSVIL